MTWRLYRCGVTYCDRLFRGNTDPSRVPSCADGPLCHRCVRDVNIHRRERMLEELTVYNDSYGVKEPVKCQACPQLIAFMTTMSGKTIPVDWDSLSVTDTQHYRDGLPVAFSPGRHITHFRTCPEAKRFRKSGKLGTKGGAAV
jgi:hypothetical protein